MVVWEVPCESRSLPSLYSEKPVVALLPRAFFLIENMIRFGLVELIYMGFITVLLCNLGKIRYILEYHLFRWQITNVSSIFWVK